jgi:hypothetical protein
LPPHALLPQHLLLCVFRPVVQPAASSACLHP